MSTSIDDCLCDKGFYRNASSSGADGTSCSECSINSYKDWTGNEACKQCSENSGTNMTGSTSSAQCLCRPGYYYNSELRECLACRNPFKYCPGGETDCSEGDKDCVGGKKPIQPIECPAHTRITEGFDTPSSLDDCKSLLNSLEESSDNNAGTAQKRLSLEIERVRPSEHNRGSTI